ncbi:MAG: 5-dehydro-2-deoxygluconokinase [Pseudomonadota bacterium]
MADLARLRMNRFLVIGRAGMDFYADPPGAEVEHVTAFTCALGGSAGNTAAGMARLGAKVDLITRVSDDAVGRYVLNQLDAYGVGRRFVRSEGGEARTSLAVVESRLVNTQSVIYRNGAADLAMGVADVAAPDYADYGAVVLSGTALADPTSRTATMEAINRAQAAKVPVVIDLDYRPYSWTSADEAAAVYAEAAQRCDVIVGNDVEFDVLAGQKGAGHAAARDLASQAGLVVYKMGERGAVSFMDGVELATGIYPVQALKPTGAGDSFMAGLLTGLAQGADLRSAILRGSACAAIVVTKVGCAPAMPDEDQLAAFLAGHPGPSQPDLIPETADAHSAP